MQVMRTFATDKEARTPGEEELAEMRVFAAVAEAAKSDRSVRVRG